MTEVQERRPAPLYIYRPDDHAPLDAEGLAWLADQLCSEDRVHPDRTMASGWITTQAAYEFPALLDRLATARAEAEALRQALETAEQAMLWAGPRMACPAYREVIENDARNARAALSKGPTQ